MKKPKGLFVLKKKIISIILTAACAVSLITGCGKSTDTAGGSDDSTADSSDFNGLIISRESTNTAKIDDDGNQLTYGYNETVSLDTDKMSALGIDTDSELVKTAEKVLKEASDTVDEFSTAEISLLQQTASDAIADTGKDTATAIADGDFDAQNYYFYQDMEITRSDSNVLSLYVIMDYNDSDTDDDVYGYQGYNYDLSTGKNLELDQIVTDTDKAVEAAAEVIYNENGPLDIDSDPGEEEAVKEIAEQISGMLTDPDTNGELIYTLNPEGLTFSFGSETVIGQAYGNIIVELYYSGNEDLFNDSYAPGKNADFIRELETDQNYNVFSDGTDKDPDTLYIYYDYAYEDDGETIKDDAYTLYVDYGEAEASIEMPDTSGEFYLLRRDGKYYLYITDYDDTGYWRQLYVCTLDDTENLDQPQEYDMGFYDEVPTDIDAMPITEENDVLGSNLITCLYHAGDDGQPVSDSDGWYAFSSDIYGTAYTLKQDITTSVSSDVNKSAGDASFSDDTVSSGTVLYPYRSDGGSTVDLINDDRTQIVRITVDDPSVRPQTIDGTSAEDIFDGIIYLN